MLLYWNVFVPGISSRPSDESLELFLGVADLQRGLVADQALADAFGQVLVERQHAVAAAGLHERGDLVRLALADQAPDGRRRGQDLGDHRAALAVRLGRQRLGDHALEAGRELGTDL